MLKSSWGLPPTVIGRYGSIASIDGIVKNGDHVGRRDGVKDMRLRSVATNRRFPQKSLRDRKIAARGRDNTGRTLTFKKNMTEVARTGGCRSSPSQFFFQHANSIRGTCW